MAYSQASISNLALGRIGARGQIVDVNDPSPNAVKVLSVWDAIFQEVLSERDWKFAKTRVPLQLSTVTPLYTWKFAWALPADFLRVTRPRRRQNETDLWCFNGYGGQGWYSQQDPPFFPYGWDYRVETLTSGWDLTVNPPIPWGTGTTPPTPFPSGKYALTNYGGWLCGPNNQPLPAAMTYIRLITDYSQLMPGFVNALAWRLAQELSIGVTEDKQKWEMCRDQYKESLNSAEAQNETMDTERDEDGSDAWVRAGRYADSYGWRY
jgi:hypothetical protein